MGAALDFVYGLDDDIKSGQLGIVIPAVIPANAGIHDPAPPPSLDTRVRGYDDPPIRFLVQSRHGV
jgi:hypothetical protein